MEENKKQDLSFSYEEYGDMTAKLYTRQGPVNFRKMSGKLLVNLSTDEVFFEEYNPRRVRSVELCRTSHARCVRNKDGVIVTTFRFRPEERYMTEKLISELRTIMNELPIQITALKRMMEKTESDAE